MTLIPWNSLNSCNKMFDKMILQLRRVLQKYDKYFSLLMHSQIVRMFTKLTTLHSPKISENFQCQIFIYLERLRVFSFWKVLFNSRELLGPDWPRLTIDYYHYKIIHSFIMLQLQYTKQLQFSISRTLLTINFSFLCRR